MTLILSGIKTGEATADFITSSGKLIFKFAMLAIPLATIVAGYFIYLRKFRIDEDFYKKILQDLRARGQLQAEEASK